MDDCSEGRVIDHERVLAVLEHRVDALEVQTQAILSDIRDIKNRSFWTLLSTSALLVGFIFQVVIRKVGL